MSESSVDADMEKQLSKLIESAAGIHLAVSAANKGTPALCGVDELLRKEIGEKYRRDNNATWSAGYYVARLMREMGYVDGPTKKCPEGCMAREGLTFRPPLTDT